MKMETPKNENAQGSSNTLKSLLQNQRYLKALEKLEKAQKKLLKIIDQ